MSFPDVSELLPHRPPMVLLDSVLDWEDKTARCGVTLREGAPFVEDGKARAAVALEYMAQCVGVCTALRSLAKGEPLQKGYLVGARNMSLETAFFNVGDTLVVEATEEFDGDELGSFLCSVSRADEVLVTASLSVFRGRPRGERT